MKALDLRARLLFAVAVVAILQGVVAFAVISVTRDHLIDQIDERLAVAASPEREPGTDHDEDEDSENDHDEDHDEDRPEVRASRERLGDTYEGLLGADGTLVTLFAPNSTGVELAPPDIGLDQLGEASRQPITVDATEGELHYRLRATEVLRQGDAYLITAVPLNSVDATMSKLASVLALAAAAIVLVLALTTWWVLRLGIAPIKRMTTTAGAIAAGDLSVRIADADPRTEAGQLGDALNTMLGRIESSFDERTRAEGRLRQFIADASHELRTPVATIRGYAELYRNGGLENQAELADAMRRTEQESQRMSRLIADMLSLAKLDRDPTLSTKAVDLATLAQDAVGDARVTHADRNITLDLADQALVIDGNEDMLRQVFANLTDNAITHTDHAASVTVRGRTEGMNAIIEVIDTGAGMAPEIAARVTERFFRADASRSRHQGGSGLGLAIAESIVDAHGGQLDIESNPGEGTTVTMTIPLAGRSAE